MPTVPPSGSRSSRVSNARSLPSARRRPSAPRSRVATPAESYPLYSRRLSASTSCPATGLVPKIPTIPHIRLDGPFAQLVWFSLRRQVDGNHNAFRRVTCGEALLTGNHGFFCFFPDRILPKAFTCRKRFAQPSLTVCLARAIATAPAGTSSVTTVPEPTQAPSPTLTG